MTGIPKTIKKSTYEALRIKSEYPATRNMHSICIYNVLKNEIEAGRTVVIDG